ncbi:helix-turn-helix domain-containing protein [Flavihumibacter fluvii]|uniref:helix-turn-helix domain-containing protein n=1 Tax=Flavihumibacter fluvii TaxID=2838157 RepID=UPI001BDE5F27|nr:helix-turn-helix domain-containing protein [Flavihumibacter fluvii]ULQ50896.1 helix-turn-helix domain-containing protein [Flavihumibacter fluvii]
MQLLYLASEILVLFILLVILGKKNKQSHDKILILWLFLILVNTQGFNLQPGSRYYYFIELSSAVVFLHGPVIFFYYLTLTSKKNILNGKHLLHLLPFIINIGIIFPALMHQRLAAFTETERNILMMAKLVSIILYTMITIVHLNWHIKTVRDYFSNMDKKDLQWLRLILYGILCIWILAILSQVLVQLGNQYLFKKDEDLLVNIAVSLLVIILGYYGFRQGSVFQNMPVRIVFKEQQPGEIAEVNQEQPPTPKYKKSGLNKELVQQLALSLQDHIVQKQPYLEPELTLQQLAQAVKLSANDLSQVINEYFGVNFFDFINGYRVKAIKTAIANGELDKKTLLGIALESGFNSKASFNRAFKKMTGLTPTEYIAASKSG